MRKRLPEGTYLELIRRLYATLSPTAIMAICFSIVGLVILGQTPDPLLTVLTLLGIIAAAARLVILASNRIEAADPALGFAAARRLERLYATSYFAFALIFGAFSARAFMIASAEGHMLVIGLLFGYGAGVTAGLSLRPWISVPCILIATLPTMTLAAMQGSVIHGALALLLLAFLSGGVQAMLTQYHYGSRSVTMRLFFATLARSDPLTGLPNRLALREWMDRLGSRDRGMIALHYLDLDGFKPVNDRHGHPMGDLLLQAVGERLSGLLRPVDCIARVGGDEFVLVQGSTRHASEADLLARRIVRAIAQPFAIGDLRVVIGTSVGYALAAQCGDDLDRLIACADEALCGVKLQGGGIAAYHARPPDLETRLQA